MKKKRLILIANFIVIFALFFTSCTKDDDEPTVSDQTTENNQTSKDSFDYIAINNLIVDLSDADVTNNGIVLSPGQIVKLSAAVTPDNATDKTVSFKSSDDTIITIGEDGTVTAIGTGKAVIVAAAGSRIFTCSVVVQDNNSGISPDIPNEPTEIFFSVSESKKVMFSPGNLQYNASKNEYRFAEHQYDIIGEYNQAISDDNEAWIDLFGWGTGNKPSKSSTDKELYTSFNDWGNNIGGNWYTLSKEEWSYLIIGREDANKKFGIAQVNSVNGLVILPDSFTLPTGLTFNSGVTDAKKANATDYETINSYTDAEWSLMESNGAIFLPTAGYRYGTSVYDFEYGLYWSSTISGTEYANYLKISSNDVSVQAKYRYGGQSVRLVRNIE